MGRKKRNSRDLLFDDLPEWKWGKHGKPDKVREIEKVIREHLLTGSVQVENLAREIYLL